MQVCLRGLRTSPDLNGACGTVKGVKDGRFVVSLAEGRCVLAKATNIQPRSSTTGELRDMLQKSVLVQTAQDGEILAYGMWCDMEHIDPPPEKLEVWRYMRTKSIATYEAQVPDQVMNIESIMIDGPNDDKYLYIVMLPASEVSDDSLVVEVVWRKSDNFVASLHRAAFYAIILPSQTQLSNKLTETFLGKTRDTRHFLMTNP